MRSSEALHRRGLYNSPRIGVTAALREETESIAQNPLGRFVRTEKRRRRLRMHIEVDTQNVDGQVTALGSAGHFTLVVDRPWLQRRATLVPRGRRVHLQ